MFLQQLIHAGLRNLISSTLQFSPRFNIFFGKNGSGKTSILECIHVLSTGRSFRTAHAAEFIQFGETSSTLSGIATRLEPFSPSLSSSFSSATGSSLLRFGLERPKSGAVKIRIAERSSASIADLAKILPIQLINIDTYQLLSAASKGRRQFLDWGLFHVEHSFFPAWCRYGRALKQRNMALKRANSGDFLSIRAWNAELIEAGTEIEAFRQNFLKEYFPIFMELLSSFLPHISPDFEYKRGWPEGISLEEALEHSLDRDLALGFTTRGPHKADILFSININDQNGQNFVKNVLSRGQLKLFVCALLLARAKWLLQKTGQRCLFLVDDLCSELDREASLKLIEGLKSLGCQVFVTAVDMSGFGDVLNEAEHKMFHVEHGKCTLENSDM